ncbi:MULTISPECIES: hypothetical protein [Actinokineospora]|uniref:hypothetical protein n=1 Tax=Actinokineospora TaxID=39845 RepID=UPI000555094A|nr:MULTISPECIES: hypothetical protein [Actinokineospora]MCG8916162.1 hypothetical protein [Actinokineospora sp. PR83]
MKTPWWKFVLVVVCFLVGGVWTFQGLGVIGGSFMTGSPVWLAIGLVLVLAGVWLLVETLRARRR